MSTDRNYFLGLCEKLKSLISLAITDKSRDWFAFNKGAAAIQLVGPGEVFSGKSDLELQFTGFEVLADTDGTFNAESSPEEVFVFKMPSRICASFLLRIPARDLREGLRNFDRLTSSFFNKKSVENYVPEEFREIPALYSLMNASRAEISLKKAAASPTGGGYEMQLEYKGLFHSGDPIRTEKRVRQRILQVNKTKEGN